MFDTKKQTKMKKIVLLLLFFTICNGFSQGEIDCEQKYEEFQTYYKTGFNQKNILTQNGREETLSFIQLLAKECSSYSKEIYIYSEEMLLRIINPMNFGTERQQWTRYLVDIYDQYSKNFPETTQENTLKKIIISYKNKVYPSTEEALKIIDYFFSKNKRVFSTEALLIYTDLLTEQGRLTYDFSVYIKKIFDLNQSLLAKISELEQQKKHLTDLQIVSKINTDIESLKIATKNIDFDKIKFDCDQLNTFLKNDFEKNKTNTQWIDQTLTILEKQKCVLQMNDDFFSELVHTYYDLEKSAKSTLYMGNLALQKKEYQNAILYFNQSVQLETDNTKKAFIYYQIANLYSKDQKTERKEYLQKALENNPEMLTACLSLAQLYIDAERDCFHNDFIYKTRYYLAIQLLERFAEKNPNYQKNVQPIIKEYYQKIPTKKEIKKAKIKGKTIKIECWINQEFELS